MNQSTILHNENGETYVFIGVPGEDGRLEVQAAIFGNRAHLFHQKDIRGANSCYFNNKDHRRLVSKARAKGQVVEAINWADTTLIVKRSGGDLDVRCIKSDEDISNLFIKVLLGRVENIAQHALSTAKKEG